MSHHRPEQLRSNDSAAANKKGRPFASLLKSPYQRSESGWMHNSYVEH
jgi:hypothetical protein